MDKAHLDAVVLFSIQDGGLRKVNEEALHENEENIGETNSKGKLIELI